MHNSKTVKLFFFSIDFLSVPPAVVAAVTVMLPGNRQKHLHLHLHFIDYILE